MQHKRVRANLVWNDYFFEMIKELSTGEHKGIRLAKIPYNQGFAVNDKFFIKFKKADSNFLSSNLQTQSAMKYHDPEIDMFGGEVRLELLYVLDDDGINIDKIAIVQRKDKFVAWAIDIEGDNIAEIPQTFEPSTTETAKTVAKKVIKPRKHAKENVVNKDGTNS
jgi:predicted HicB family RNase H-like nuclease